MSFIYALAIAATLYQPPSFDPLRGHAWGESGIEAQTLEAVKVDVVGPSSRLAEFVLKYGTGPLTYELTTNSTLHDFSLGFENFQLRRILYSLLPPSSSEGHAESVASLPERFEAVRTWIMARYGKPSNFVSSDSSLEADFNSVDTLLRSEPFHIKYVWCTKRETVYLSANRGKKGVSVVALLESHLSNSTGESGVCTD